MNLNQKIQSFLNEHKNTKKRLSATALLSLLISLSVVSSLIMPAISMTMASISSDAGENSSISLITQATAGVPSTITDSTTGQTMLDLTSADKWTASLMCNNDYFYEATNDGVTTNKSYSTTFDEITISAYIEYEFDQNVSSHLTGSGPHLGWDLGNPEFTAKFIDEDGNELSCGTVSDPNYTAGIAGTYVIENGFVKVTLTDDYIAFVKAGTGSIKGSLDFSGTLSQSNSGSGNQSFTLNGETVIVDFPDKYPTMNKGATVNTDGTVTWNVYINNSYNVDLSSYSLSDTMLTSAYDIKVSPDTAATVNGNSIAFTAESAASQWITITYKTNITEAELKNGSSTNEAHLKPNDGTDKDIPASSTATFNNPFTVDKTGKQDYQSGAYGNMINWIIDVKSKYGTSLNGYIIEDANIPNGTVLTASDNSIIESLGNGKWKLHTTNPSVTITYSAPATAGQTNSNTATLLYPDNTTTNATDKEDIPYDEVKNLITVEKSGYAVNSNGTISWTIKVKNPYGLSLDGDTVTDKMLSSAVGTVNISPAGSGTHSGSTVTLSGKATEITITYTTKITDAQLNAGTAENDVSLKHGDNDQITDDADVPLPDPFDVTKNGTPDYKNGTYDHKINWTVTIKSNYSTSLDGYYISDSQLPKGATATPSSGSLTWDDTAGMWKLSGTSGNIVTIKYQSAAVDGNNKNSVDLYYSENVDDDTDSDKADGTETTVEYKDESGIISLNKGYTINTTDGTIEWTIAVSNQYGLNLEGYTITDLMLIKAIDDAVTFSPAGSGTYDAESGLVTLTSATEGQRYITIKYSTAITETELKDGKASNKATLKSDSDDNNDGNDDTVGETTKDATFTSPYFNVTKTGNQDYVNGNYGSKITWTIKLESKYGSSFDGYILTDTFKENGSPKDVDLSSATVSPSGSLTKNDAGNWVISGTNGANTVYITYTTDAVGGTTYSNEVGLGYPDGTDTGVNKGSSGDVEYKSSDDLVTLNKYGYYDKDTHTIRWTINVSLLGGNNDCVLTDTRFPDSKDKLSFSPDISNCAVLNGDTLTITDSTSSSFTISYYDDVEEAVLAGTTVIENKVNDTTATVPVENRNELTKRLNSNGYETVNSNGVVTRTLNWIANITRDDKFAGQVYTDKLDLTVKDADNAVITGDGSAHTITNEQLAAIVVKARTTQYGSETTLALGTDYTITRTDTGFQITFNATLDEANYNYVTITYSTTATAGAVTSSAKFPVTYVFGNGAGFAGEDADGGDFTLVKNDPVLKTPLDLTATKNWQNDTYADRPDSIYIKVWYYTNKDSTWRTLRGSGTDYIYYGDAGYDSASDYIIKIDKDANNYSQSSTLTGLYKEVALPEADGTRGSSTYYYYKIEEVNAVTDASGNVTYESIANNSFDTSNGTYEVTYLNNNGINYTGSITVGNKFYRTTAVTPVKEWTGDEGSGNGILSVTVRLEYSIGGEYYPVEISSGKYVFDFGAETAGTTVLTQNVNITAKWQGTTWDNLPTAMIVDGALKTVSYRIVETAYTTTASGTKDIDGSRFVVDNGYYDISTYGGSDGNGGQKLTVKNDFKATEQLSVNANKVWSGDESEEYSDNRPDAILVKLQQRSSANYQWTDYETETVDNGDSTSTTTVITRQLNEGNNWSYEWNVPNQSVSEDGTAVDYIYRVVEVGYVDGENTVYFNNENQTSFATTSEGKYAITYNNGNQWSSSNELSTGGTVTVTNTFTPVGTIDITPQKKWVGDADFAATDRPTSITFTLQRKVGNGEWEYADVSGNAVSNIAAAHSVVLKADDSTTTDVEYIYDSATNQNEEVSVTYWNADTLTGLPERIVVLGDNGTYTEQICQYRFLETAYTSATGESKTIDVDAVKFKTENGIYTITNATTTYTGTVTNINSFKESIGIIKDAIDSKGNSISTLETDDLVNYKKQIDGKDYYVFNWTIEYESDKTNLATPLMDVLPEGFTLIEDSVLNATETSIDWTDPTTLLTPLDPKYANSGTDGYYLSPCIIWCGDGSDSKGHGANYVKEESSIADAWKNPGMSPSRYYYDEESNVIYFGLPSISVVPYFAYSIKIECDVLEAKIVSGSYTFSNIAERYEVTSDGTGTATEKTDSASIKIISPVDTDLITKTYQGKTNTPGEIKFSLNINPQGKNLSTGSTIDIQDVFDTVSYLDADIGSGKLYDASTNPDNYQKLVDVLMSNIKLYEVDANGNKIELGTSDYTLLFATGDETGNGALMQLTVPDEKHIIIDYTYKLIANDDTPSVVNGCKSSTRVNGRYATMAPGFVPPAKDQINFTNTATLKADSATDDSTVKETNYTVFKSSGTISTNALPKIKKVKTSDYSIDTLNASFMLAKYEKGMWYYSTAIDEEGAITWGAEGMNGTKVSSEAQPFSISGSEDFPVAVDEDVLYKVIEVAYPTDGGEFEGSNLFPDAEENEAKALFAELILNYLNDGSTFIGDKDYSVFLNNYVSTHYFTYNSTVSAYPSEVDPDAVIQVKVGGNIEVPNNELIDISVNKNWVNPQSAIEDSEITVELYWSYEKSASVPTEWELATAEALGIMDENFSAEKTLTITTDEDGNLVTEDVLWTDLPNGKNDKPIYYYIKETSYTIGGVKYTLNEEGEYVSSSGTGPYLPTYVGNAANTSTTIDVRNSYQLMLKKEWKNSANIPMRNIPVDKVIVSIYGIDNDGAMTKNPLFTDVEISAANDWTTDITALLGTTDLSMYKSFVAEESAGSSLDGYVVSCVFNLNADTGEIIVTNKNTTPTEASVTVDKVWSDGDAMHANDSITVTLYQLDYELSNLDDLEMKLPDDCKMSKIDDDDTQQYVDVELNADNDWTYTWTGLPLEDEEDQSKYYYYVLETVTEKAADGSGVKDADKYSASYVVTSQTTSNTVFKVTNTRKSISIQKQWLDEDGYDVSDEISIESIELEVLKKVATVPEEGLEVYCLGDSITDGYNKGTPYPEQMTGILTGEGYEFKLNNLNNNLIRYSGYPTVQISNSSTSGLRSKVGDISKTADVVCLLGGTNDIHQNGYSNPAFINPTECVNRLKAWVGEVQSHVSGDDEIIVVGGIPHFFFYKNGSTTDGYTYWTQEFISKYDSIEDAENAANGYIDQFNALIKDFAEQTPNVYYADTCAAIKDESYIADGCHPNTDGYYAIAEAFAKTIKSAYTQTPKVGDITLTAENNWMASYDIASSDTTTEYYVNESSVPAGWVVSYENQNQKLGSGVPITVKNTRNVPKTSLSVEKVWENDSGDTSARDSIYLTLYQSIDKVVWVPYDVEMPAPTKSEDGTIWTYNYTGLPAEDNDGNQLYYKVEEDPMSGYTTKYNVNILEAVDGGNAGSMQITNTRAISMKLKKDWSDYDPETKTHLGDTVILKIYRGLLADGRGDDYSDVDLVLQVTPKNLGLTVGGEAATITANKALTEITPSEGYEEYITYELSPDGKTITVTAIKETDTPVTLTVTDGTDTETITITASAYTLYYDGEKASSVPSMRVDETGHKLSVKKGSSTYTDVTYESNDESILTVDPTTGEITGVNIGTASVSVYTNDNLTTPIFTQDIAVGLPETFEIVQKTGTAKEVTIGSSIQLGVDKDYGTFNWESKDPSKATVTVEEDGTVKVTGVAAGSVTITATRAAYGDDPALTKEYTIDVANGDIFENDNVVVKVKVGESVTITSDTSMKDIDYHDGSIVSTSASGYELTITGVKAGEITITVHNANDYNDSASFKVIVSDPFSVSPTTKTLEYGGTVTLTPNTTDAVTYTIKSGANLIDISGNTVTAKSGTEGTAVIEAKNTVTGETATVTITIVEKLSYVTLTGLATGKHDFSMYDYQNIKAIGFKCTVNPSVSPTNANIATIFGGVQVNSSSGTWVGNVLYLTYSGQQNGNFEMYNYNTYAIPSIDEVYLYYEMPVLTSSVSNLSLYGASMSNMLFGADADIAPAADVLNYQLYTTVELEYNAAAPEGEKWTEVLEGLDVYDSNGNEYIYWVVEDPTFSDYSVSYLFEDSDGSSDYWINAAEPNSNGEFVATVRNTKQESEGVEMPSTGGEGTAKFYYTGGAMVLLALIAGSNRIRRRIKERRAK